MECKEENLYQYTELATGLRPWKCEVCKARFLTESEAKAHAGVKREPVKLLPSRELIRRTTIWA